MLTIGIIGSGRMGTDIFYYLAEYNFRIVWVCLTAEDRRQYADTFSKKYNRLYKNGLIDDEHLAFRKSSTVISNSYVDLAECDIVIEAIWEDEESKIRLISDIEPHLDPNAVVATNSSSIKPSVLAAKSNMKDRCIGLHFFYPVKYKNIAEIIIHDGVSASTVEVIKKFLSIICKFYLVMHEKDGFVLNKILLDLQAQAYRLYADGILDIQEIDSIVKSGLFPMGVFEFFDTVGIRVMYRSVLNYVQDREDRTFYEPLINGLGDMVRSCVGDKSVNQLFYMSSDIKRSINDLCSDQVREKVADQLMCLFINSAYKALEKNICSLADLEYAVTEYLGIDKGPFALGKDIGLDIIVNHLNGYYEMTGYTAFQPSKELIP